MRKIILIFLLFLGANAFGQDLKFGHINMQEVLKGMPELKVAQDSIGKIKAGLQAKSDALAAEYNDKLKKFEENQKDKKRSAALNKADVEELNSIKARKEKFDADSNTSLQADIDQLIQPIIDKANKAISEVAGDQGLIYVFEVNGLLFHSAKSVSILPKVKDKLGIK